ncbi:SecY-interacting protein [Aestuariibacter sp. GS-14]|uniref:SecY-interacting protein n=1 Tax=Aestuariibacter sp. GS-14 TaxID=2590670 RepID=UPI0011297D33|nr:SecY-interacting protein [Aestuariibacter sp. GS-14]TPV62062.1 SecY-interacting protein [Aestuariibacter sp. GS-14]
MEQIVQQSLHNLVQRLQADTNTIEQRFKIEYDPDWPSPCYQEAAQAGMAVNWQPVAMDLPLNFANIESALNISLNEQFCQFFTTNWSFNLLAQASDGQCELLQVCNADDFERLQQNLIGHLMMKQRLKQPLTLFFGLTDEDDFILSVDNTSGEVVLEQVGRLPVRKLAPDLATFLDGLS